MDKKFLDKVVNSIVDTNLEKYGDPIPLSTLVHPYITHFIKDCRTIYGLKDVNEIIYVWEKYKEIIKEKLDSKENLNESTGMNYKFLNKVVDSIVDETVIKDDKSISTPFSKPQHFKNHCQDVYGLKDEQEIDYVWKEYRTIIWNKLFPY